MKEIVITETEIVLKDFPNNLEKLIKGFLDTKDSGNKLASRKTLAAMGKTVLPKMHKLLETEDVSFRMEVAKILELIADSRSIPIFIRLLDDKEFEIRWIAAEGLIKIGRRSIIPMLKSVRDGESSHFHNEGVHHVLLSLINKTEKDKLVQLLNSLENYHELGETAPIEALKALKTVFKSKSVRQLKPISI
jgi:hypothetical protein